MSSAQLLTRVSHGQICEIDRCSVWFCFVATKAHVCNIMNTCTQSFQASTTVLYVGLVQAIPVNVRAHCSMRTKIHNIPPICTPATVHV